MKAHINGITVEGTPEEIMEYQRLKNEQSERKPYKHGTTDADWLQWFPKVTSGSTKRCAHPCNCTGACEGKTQTDSSIFNLNHTKL